MSNTTNTESFAQLFEESLAKQEMRQGEVITAEVLRVEHNFVVVNAGLKSEAYVPIEEFKDDLGEVTVQPGDFVSVAIESAENGFGETVLSRDKAVKDTTPFEGKTLEFKVIKLDRKRNNVVVSRRAVVEASMGEERAKLLATLKEGAIVKGIVKNITDYGAFVDLGGIDGLLHITDRKSKPRSSSSTRKRAAFPSASSSWAKIRGSALLAATRRTPVCSAR